MQKLLTILTFISTSYCTYATEDMPPPLVHRQAFSYLTTEIETADSISIVPVEPTEQKADEKKEILTRNSLTGYIENQFKSYPKYKKLFLARAFVFYTLYTSAEYTKKLANYNKSYNKEESLNFIKFILHLMRQIDFQVPTGIKGHMKTLNLSQSYWKLERFQNHNVHIGNVTLKKKVQELIDELETYTHTSDIIRKIFLFSIGLINSDPGFADPQNLEGRLINRIYFEFDTMYSMHSVIAPEEALPRTLSIYNLALKKYKKFAAIAYMKWFEPFAHAHKRVRYCQPIQEPRKRAKYRK